MNHGFLWICARSGIGKSYGNSIFSFSRNFHNVLHSDCVNLHSHWECKSVPFFPHSIIYCLQIWGWWPFWLVWGDSSLYFSFAFLWLLVMLSIFSYAFWSSVCLLWRNVCLYTLPPFLWDCLFDTEMHELFLYFGDYSAALSLFANISSHSMSCLFVYSFFCCGKLLTLIKGHLFIFVFIFITPGGGSKTILLKGKKYCCNLCQTVFCQGFPLRVLESLALHFSLWSNLSLFLCVVLENVLNSLFPM